MWKNTTRIQLVQLSISGVGVPRIARPYKTWGCNAMRTPCGVEALRATATLPLAASCVVTEVFPFDADTRDKHPTQTQYLAHSRLLSGSADKATEARFSAELVGLRATTRSRALISCDDDVDFLLVGCVGDSQPSGEDD